MASLEDELRDLKQRNNDLVQKVQHWKMLAAQREDEKMDLMKEINELRLKLSRLRNNGSVTANNLDAALQSAAQKALAHLVRASGEIATTMDLAKAYMRDREQLNNESPRWSAISGTPATAKKDKVHRVPPLMIGGQSIQPVVALTMLDTSNARSAARNSNPNRSVTERAVPMHMLQDVYIPLTRVDIDLQTQNMDTEGTNNPDDSSELLQLDDNEEETVEESQRMDENEDFDSIRILDAVIEEEEPETETPPRAKTENPLEGPSWMLDTSNNNQPSTSKFRRNLEPDSTTELGDLKVSPIVTEINKTEGTAQLLVPTVRMSREFSPTVRRRKRTSTPPPLDGSPRAPHYSPRPPARRLSNNGRVLKVLVAKMRLDTEGEALAEGSEGSPPKRAATAATLAASHAPSPNGATVPGVIVEENNQDEMEVLASGEPLPHKHRHRQHIFNNSDIDILEEHRINIDRRTKSKDRNDPPREHNERANSREINQTIHMELQQSNSQERTNSRKRNDSQERDIPRPDSRNERHRDRNKHTDTEVQHSDRNERARERTNSRDRKHTNKEVTMEIQIDRREHSRRAEERDKQIIEKTDYRLKPSHSRDRSNERHDDVRTGSRASNDLSHDDTSRGASESRAGSCDSDSGSGGERESRARRPRKAVVYKEKPLNRKMRR